MATVDILHPLASLEWKECQQLPVGMSDATAVWYEDKLYVGGGTSGNFTDLLRLYIYTPTTDTWDTPIDTPVYWFALTTYHSQLVLVGGKAYSESYVSQLWTLSEDCRWQETLPPMGIERHSACAASYGDHLLVAGGVELKIGISSVVEIFNGSHWLVTQPLPIGYYNLKSVIFDENWYLMGGCGCSLEEEKAVHYASLDSLLASCRSSETSKPSSVWKRLTDVPNPLVSTAALFGSRLIDIGGEECSHLSAVHAYSFPTNSWIHVGDIPVEINQPYSIVLPTGELMVVGGFGGWKSTRNVLKATVKVTSYDPDSQFTMSALSRLEDVGIPVITSLSNIKIELLQQFFSIVVPNAHVYTHPTSLLNAWLSRDVSSHTSTWKNLLMIIRILNLDDLAQRMETYLSEAKMEYSKEDEDVDKKLYLRDDKVSAMQQRINDLQYENEELKHQLHLATFNKAVKTEVKEEAVTVTKAETMSAQPTTDTWNLRGVEVCGEMTVVVYSSHYQQITWPGYGLRLHIPKGCLPAGMEQCTINIKASLAGQYEFPENSLLVSAIFWLRCEDVHKFTRPITVEIQHCAKLQNITDLKLSIVRTVCSQKQLPYTFKQLPGGNFTSHSSYGVIELNSFSGVGVTQEGSEDREYCSQLFYLGQPDRCKIHYVVTWNTEAHLTVVMEEYTREGAIRDLYQLVEFESDTISLDIPLEGVNTKGWKITPLMRPVVTKKQVDNFRGGKLTPCCQLLAEVSTKKKKIPTLKHQVNLKGAKYPNDIFVITLPAGDTNPQESSQTFGDLAKAVTAGPPPIKKGQLQSDESAFPLPTATQSLPTKVVSTDTASSAGPSSAIPRTAAVAHTGLDTRLDLRFNHFQATIYLQSLDERQIRRVGGALGLTYDVLEKMKTLPDDMVAAWLRREDFVMSTSGEPTWRTLVEALRKVGQEGTARDIEAAEHD